MDSELKNFFQKWLHIVLGCLVTASGLIILKHSHVITGGTAGLSLSLSYLFHAKFHYLFILLNIPFIIFSFFKMGRSFTLRTVAAIGLLSALTSIDTVLSNFSVPSLAGSIVGGIVVGVGICTLFNNGASIGGSTILALYLQKRYQLDPGKTNFAFDFMVLLTSFSALSLNSGLISGLSIVITSAIISFYKERINSAQRLRQSNPATAATT